MPVIEIFLFLASVAVLARSATWLITSLTQISALLHLSEFTVGFVMMSLATSLPELFVCISAAIQDSTSLIIGNTLGSNIADLTIAIGIAALLARGIRVRRVTQRQDALFMSVVALAPLALLYDGTLSRLDGALLLVVYIFYLFRLIRQKTEATERISAYHGSRIKPFVSFFLGVALLVASAHVLVHSATEIATVFGVPLLLIGFSIVAIGTSLPEIAFEARAILSQHRGMVFGDVLGSVVTNSSLVMGVAALIRPINIGHPPQLLVSATFTVCILMVFNFFIRSRSRLSWMEGVGLIFFYTAFLVTVFAL